MSGHKRSTISIPEEDYRRLHEVEMRLRFMQAEIPGLIERASHQTHAQLDRYQVEFEQRQMEFVGTLQAIDVDLAALEARTGEAMLEHQAEIHQQLTEMAGSLWEQAGMAIAQVEQHYQEHIQAVQQENSDQMLLISQELEYSRNLQRDREIIAQRWIGAALSVVRFIAEHYDHESLAAGHLRGWERRLYHAQQNLRSGMAEAALALSQDAYLGLSDLRIWLEKLQAEHQALLQAAQEYLLRLEHEAHTSIQVQALDLAGNPLPIQVDVDFWSGGRLLELTREIENIRADIAQAETHPSAQVLEFLLNKHLPELQERLSDIVFSARLAVLSSQLRLNIADRVLSALSSQGYALQEGSFEGGDARDTFRAHLSAMDGSEVLVRVDPVNGQGPKNELHLIAQDQQGKTQHELRQRAMEVQRALQQTGLVVGRMVQEPLNRVSSGKPQPQSLQIAHQRARVPIEK